MAFLTLCVWEVTVTFYLPVTFVNLSVVFLGFNMMPIVVIIYRLFRMTDATLEEFLKEETERMDLSTRLRRTAVLDEENPQTSEDSIMVVERMIEEDTPPVSVNSVQRSPMDRREAKTRRVQVAKGFDAASMFFQHGWHSQSQLSLNSETNKESNKPVSVSRYAMH